MKNESRELLIKSKKRVRDHGEVFTPDWVVEAMLDLVKAETENIDAKFLEPACGEGNFLVKVLERKLRAAAAKYKNQFEYEKNAFLAAGSLYGIDLLEDNVLKTRKRLFGTFRAKYEKLYPQSWKKEFLKSIQFVLSKNIVQGDALTMLNDKSEPIIFSQWSIIKTAKVKRVDFSFAEILKKESMKKGLFAEMETKDLGLKPIKEHPPVSFYELGVDF